MGWLQRILVKEQDFIAEDYRKKYPQMHPDDAETLAELNRLIKEAKEKQQKEQDNEHLR